MASGDLTDCEVKLGHEEDAMHVLRMLHNQARQALPTEIWDIHQKVSCNQ